MEVVPLIFLSLDLNDFDTLSFLHKGLGQSDMDLCQFYDMSIKLSAINLPDTPILSLISR